MQKRLVELIKQAENDFSKTGKPVLDIEEYVASHLLGEGVIVPPMKLGQTCYMPWIRRDDINECRVSSITQKADGTFKIRLTNLRGRYVFEIIPDEIGKTVFLTHAEAEKALKGRSANDGT